MSTTTINSTSDTAVISAADKVQSQLDLLTARLRRDVWLYGLLAVAATAVGMLLAAIVLDAVIQPESTGLRFVLWIPVLAASGVTIYWLVWQPLRDRCNRLALAWSLEQQRPELEEVLTSTLLLAESSHPAGTSLVAAVAAQANRDLADCREDAATRRDPRRPALAAASCLVIAALCLAVWPQYLLPSLSNVMTPWNTRQLPYLTALISPGHIAVAEGEALEVSASGNDLNACVLEIMDAGTVLSSTPMTVAATGDAANVLLPGFSTDQSYRIRSGSLVSDIYQITVHPRPVVTHAGITLQFPEYTGIPSATVDDLSVPIAAIPGTRVRLSVATVIPTSDTRLTFGDELHGTADTVRTDGVWWHHWTLRIDEQPVQAGRLELISEYGVPSEPFSFEMQCVPDEPPAVSIKTPTLQHLAVLPDGELPIQFEAADDYGLHSVEVLMQAEDAEPKRSVVLQNLDAASHAAEYIFEPQEHDLEAGDQLMLWIVASDNRTTEHGGAQTTESRRLMITVADDAASIGRQQLTNEQNRILETLSDAILHLHEAGETAQQIADATQQLAADGVRADTNPDAQKLQQQLQDARQALENVTASREFAAELFEAEQQQIRNIVEEEVEEAQQRARMIPLMNAPDTQQQAADAARSAVKQAEEQLADLAEQLTNRAERLQQAAELDELARRQNQLARNMQERDAPQQQAGREQEQIADKLQELVQNDPEAESEQFRQRADTAEQLVERTAQLQQQQEQLTNAAASETDKEMREQLVQMIRKEQEAIARDHEQLMEGAQQKEANTAEAGAEAQQLMERVINDLAEQNLRAAEQNAEGAKRKLQEAATPQEAAGDDAQGRRPRVTPEERDRLAERQERLEEAIRAVEENRFEAAANELQKLITDRLQQVAEEAEELLELPTADQENQSVGREAKQRLQEALTDSKHASAPPQDTQLGNAPNPAAQQQQQQQQQDQDQQQDQKNSQPPARQAGDQENEQPAKQNEAGAKKASPQQPAEAGRQQADPGAEHQPGQQDRKNSQPQAQQPNTEQPQTRPQDPQQRNSRKHQQNKAAQSLKQAAESLRQFCTSCRECAQCNKPGQSGSSSGDSSQPGNNQPGNNQPGNNQSGNNQSGNNQPGDKQPGQSGQEKSSPSKQLARTTDNAQKAAHNPTPDAAKQLASELDTLAAEAATHCDYSLRNGNNGEPARESNARQQKQARAGNTSGKPQGRESLSGEPTGVGRNGQPDDVRTMATQLRGPSTSEWTRSHKRLQGNILDRKSTQIPEAYRGIVEDYFEQLSRIQSDDKEPEESR